MSKTIEGYTDVPQISDFTREVAKNFSIRLEQQIRVCIKPKPWFLTERLWYRLASIFIHIERTQPSFTIGGRNG